MTRAGSIFARSESARIARSIWRGSLSRGRHIALCIALVACKDKESAPKPQPAPPVVVDAAPIAGWQDACSEAITAKQTPVRKLAAIIDACKPCGDWTPLLDWNKPRTEGGPSEEQLDERMKACNAFCSNDSRLQFLGTAADTRGKPTQKPWRVLGEKCGEKVSAIPDTRFASAPYFALDRIARAAAADPKLAPLLETLELPLPALSISGVGVDLPESPAMKPEPGRFALTITQRELRLASLPTAKLGASGVMVNLGGAPYPGELVDLKKLATTLDAVTPRVTLIAPAGLPAQRLVEVVAAAKQHELVLAVVASGAPTGWKLPGITPVVLDTKPAKYEWKLDANVEQTIADLKSKPAEAFDHPKIVIAKDATVAHLARVLGALALRDAHSATLTNAPK